MAYRNHLIVLLAILLAGAAVGEVPEKLQQRILSKAPQIDANRDGTVTIEELRKAYPDLSERHQEAIRKHLPEIVDDQRGLAGQEDAGGQPFAFKRAAGDPETARKKGYNCLLLGHSFFVPTVGQLDDHAQSLGLTNHEQFIVKSGGGSGSPGRLWSSGKRDATHAKRLLESGNVELLAMTAHHIGSTVEDYKRWVDLAVKHNPRTVVVIQSPWAYLMRYPERKEMHELESYTAAVKRANDAVHGVIDQLRKAYPDTTFICIPQGQFMVELWRLHENDKLPEITDVLGKGDARERAQHSIFRDKVGHAGELPQKIGPLFWLYPIYGVDPAEYEAFSTGTQLDLKPLVKQICDNDPYCIFDKSPQ